ncbi:hypothetical protein J1N35_018729 [Gossypium stocksii]|uniref:Uncharacterized protein n=1 Tax=Gossypium stocksii TaxID=47602 RepID=A0A9D3VQL9_9ROSI|nr:hypothetical protein J1N35_018729 [Gossypium stocksii]
MQTHDVSLAPNSVGIQAADPLGGLNPNKHIVISFNSKGTDRGDNSKRSNLSGTGGNKFHNLGKSLGNNDGGFRATKKINKISHGKGLISKTKNSSKISLSDSMSKLAQTVSKVQNIDWEAYVSGSGKRNQGSGFHRSYFYLAKRLDKAYKF